MIKLTIVNLVFTIRWTCYRWPNTMEMLKVTTRIQGLQEIIGITFAFRCIYTNMSWNNHHNITQLMSYVHAPRSIFKNKVFGYRYPSASDWLWSQSNWRQLISSVMVWHKLWQHYLMHSSSYVQCCGQLIKWYWSSTTSCYSQSDVSATF